jgi:AcrR family transcriptional regulator
MGKPVPVAPGTPPPHGRRRTGAGSGGSVDPGPGRSDHDAERLDDHTLAVRRRLQDAMADAVAEKGLAATTIADIARHAGTSKRTFYEHYPDKTSCYLALFATRSAAMVAEVDAALRPGGLPATVQLGNAARTFLEVVTRDPVLGRGHLSELATLGAVAARARREVVDRNATSILEMLARARANGTAVRSISHLEAVCVVGGLNEIGLRALDPTSQVPLDDLVESATRFMTAVLLDE